MTLIEVDGHPVIIKSPRECTDEYDGDWEEECHITCCKGSKMGPERALCGEIVTGPITKVGDVNDDDCPKCVAQDRADPDYCPKFGRCIS